WYRTYVAEAPRGPYAAEALGREMLAIERLSGRAAATPAAHDYLARFPDGTYLLQARAILGLP
ncbi:MAG: mucin, partial [Myxococcales bacterium]|nr:mucin [Myxococcales bacterium]